MGTSHDSTSNRRSSGARGLRRVALPAIAIGAALLSVSCADGPASDEKTSVESVGSSEEALTCVTIVRGGLGFVDDAPIETDPTDPSRATTNFGAATFLTTGQVGSGTRSSLLRFDLSAIPFGAAVTSATLTLQKSNGVGGGTIDVHRVSAPWTESTVTYSSVSTAIDPTIVASLNPATIPNGSPVSIDLTSLAGSWVSGAVSNDGIALQQPPTGRTTFGSSEAGAINPRPKLSICYGPATCGDGVQNGAETGVDCGGPCAPCNACVGVVCAPLDQCHAAGVCNPGTGLCSNPASPNGTSCDDGNACTQTDSCIAGTCQGASPVVCSALDQCHSAGLCDPTTGVCTMPAVADGIACDDGDVCTASESCQSGVCTGGTGVCAVVWQGDYVVTDAASAAGLANISAITGALYMYHTSGITTLPPSPLTSIGTYLYIDHDTGLTDLSGLSNLQTIGSYLYLDHNTELTTLGLTSLTTVGAYVYITNNPALTSLGLGSLSSVGATNNGYGGYVYLDYDPALTSLDLGSLAYIEEYLYLSHTPLTTLGLTSLTQASAAYFGSNPLLPACEPAIVQAQITGATPVPCSFPATCYDAVQNGGETGVDCGGSCIACPTCSDGVQDGSEAGADCGGTCANACASCFDAVQNQGEQGVDCGFPCAVCITCTDGIQNQGETGVDCGGPCTACPTCTDGINNQGETGIDCEGPCGGSCGNVYYGTYAVTDTASAAGLSTIDVITGGLYLYHTSGVFTLPATPLSYAGYVYVDHDSDLADVSGLSNLQGVGDYLYFDANQALTTIDLPSLTHVSGYVYVTNNPVLTSVGMGALNTLEEYLYLAGNSSLSTVNFGSLTSASYVYVGSNPLLPGCTQASLDAQITGATPIPCP